MRCSLLVLAGVAAFGCVNDPDESETTFGNPSTSQGSASTGEDTASTGDVSTATSTGATSGDAGGSTGEETAGSSGVAGDCGNGMVEGDEACDDGNDSDLDACTNACAAPACDDGIQSGDESALDCGGSCSPCTFCETCTGDADCESGLCNAEGFCGFEDQMVIDSRTNCGAQPSPNTNSALVSLPAGTYLATAVNSAWNAYDTAVPPDTGWTYYAPCDGIDLIQMRTPDGIRYGDPATAFASIMADSEMFTYAGGSLACSRVDANCTDNQGSVIFDIAMVCDGAE